MLWINNRGAPPPLAGKCDGTSDRRGLRRLAEPIRESTPGSGAPRSRGSVGWDYLRSPHPDSLKERSRRLVSWTSGNEVVQMPRSQRHFRSEEPDEMVTVDLPTGEFTTAVVEPGERREDDSDLTWEAGIVTGVARVCLRVPRYASRAFRMLTPNGGIPVSQLGRFGQL